MKRLLLIGVIFITLPFYKWLGAQGRDISYMVSGGKLNPLQAVMDIRHYAITVDVDIRKQSIDGHADITFDMSRPADTVLFDLVHLLRVTSIRRNGKALPYVQQGDSIFIMPVNGWVAGRQVIRIAYAGRPPVAVRPPWKGGFTWTKDKEKNDWVVINCQMEGGKIWFPCKDHPSDEPDEGADLVISVPTGLTVAGPGSLQHAKTNRGTTAFHWKTSYPISNYCLLFNIGKYEVMRRSYETIDGHKVPIEFYVLRQDTAHAAKVMEIRARDTRILEKYFGEYPWIKEKIGIAQVPNPGMEHQTMITYGDRFTYQRINGQDYSANLFHEFGHEWWANKVTNKDWAHMWIQEGIDTYAEALCMLELGGNAAYDSIIRVFEKAIRNKKPLVQGDGVHTGDAYSSDIYFKGAYFMHSLRCVLGDDVFFKSLKELASAPQFVYPNFVTTSDVEKHFSERSGKDLKPLFDFYLRTTDKLEIKVIKLNTGEYEISMPNAPMPLPVDIALDDKVRRVMLDEKPIILKSNNAPIVDFNNNYFKKVWNQ